MASPHMTALRLVSGLVHWTRLQRVTRLCEHNAPCRSSHNHAGDQAQPILTARAPGRFEAKRHTIIALMATPVPGPSLHARPSRPLCRADFFCSHSPGSLRLEPCHTAPLPRRVASVADRALRSTLAMKSRMRGCTRHPLPEDGSLLSGRRRDHRRRAQRLRLL